MHKAATLTPASPSAVAPLAPLAVDAVAAGHLLGVSESTIKRRTRTGEIPSFKIAGATRYSVEALRRLVEQLSAAGGSSINTTEGATSSA